MRKVVLILSLLVVVVLHGQPPKKFATAFGSSGVDYGYGLIELKGSAYIIVGSTTSHGAQNSDVILLNIDSFGHKNWQQLIGGAGEEIGKAVLLNPIDSGFFIGGYTNSLPATNYDFYCIRTDKRGNVIWKKNYGTSDWDFCNSICFSSDGALIMGGLTYGGGNGGSDGLVLKIDTANGNQIWSKVIGFTSDEDFRTVITASNGDIYLAGNSGLAVQKQSDFFVVRMNVLGDTVFTKKHGHVGFNDICYDMIEDRLQNIVMCGSYDTSSSTTFKQVSYFLKADLNGNKTSDFMYGGAGPNDKMLSICSGHRGNDYFFSRSVLFGSNKIEVQPFLTMDNFGYLASTTYGGSNYEETYDVIRTSDRGYAMVGYTKSYSAASDEDIYFIKLDSTLLAAQIIAGFEEEPSLGLKDPSFYFSEGKLHGKNCTNISSLCILDFSGKIIATIENNKSEEISMFVADANRILIIKYNGLSSGAVLIKQE